jgi:hypothetical protein
MKKKFSLWYWLIPLLYISVVLFFFYLQFSVKEQFSEKVGNLVISGESSKGRGLKQQVIHGLNIHFNGFEFSFSKKNPLIIQIEDETEIKLVVKSFYTFSKGIDLQFDEGLTIRFTIKDQSGDTLSLEPIVSSKFLDYLTLSIPLDITKAKTEKITGLPLYSLNSDSGSYFISLPHGSDIDLETKRLTLKKELHSQEITLYIERTGNRKVNPYLYWFSKSEYFVDRKEFEDRLNTFLDASYQTWQKMEFQGTESSLQVESLIAALFSESLNRGDYQKIFFPAVRQFRRAMAANPGELLPSYTTPYLGGLQNYYNYSRGQKSIQIEKLTNQIKNSDLSLLQLPHLLRFILNHAPFALIEEVIRLTDGIDIEELSTEELLALLDLYSDICSFIGFSDSTTSKIWNIFSQRLLPAIIETGQGFFLSQKKTAAGLPVLTDEEYIVDLYLSIKGGSLLLSIGDLLDEAAFSAIGRNLIVSVLEKAAHTTDSSHLPLHLKINQNRIIEQSGIIPAEDIYPFLADNRYLPREIPLYSYLYPGSWIWTASQLIDIETAENAYSFSLSFPVKGSHDLIIQGLKPFSHLELHGMPWQPDTRYFQYSDGWFFEAESQTLFLKLTHKNEIEKIIIRY